MCPKGFDPLDYSDSYRTIVITIKSTQWSTSLHGLLKFTFNGYSFAFPANGHMWSR